MKHIYSALLLVGILFFLLGACNSKNEQEQSREPEPAVDSVQTSTPEFTGRLYTSGLSKAEAEKLGLQWPVFQLSGPESYFFSGSDSLQRYIGQCIKLKGAEVVWSPNSEMVNEQFTYYRGKLEFSGIIPLDEELCTSLDLSDDELLVELGGIEERKGTIRRMNRPAPDIAYDYVLRLEKPFRDENHPVQPGKLVKELPLFVLNEQEIGCLERAVATGQPVVLRGSLVQGYAENKVLQVLEVQ